MSNSTPPRWANRILYDRLIVSCSVLVPLLAAAACAFGLLACESAPGTATTFPDSALRASAAGDWDDVDAAVEIGGGQAEWVISHWWYEGPSARFYRLRNPLGTEALVRIARPERGDALDITATVGPFGDAAAEQRLVERIARRLGQLHGVDAAEIR